MRRSDFLLDFDRILAHKFDFSERAFNALNSIVSLLN
jgi:hypothetical protein